MTAVPTASGQGQQIARCPVCRVAVWSVYGGAEEVVYIRVGTLDDPNAVGGPGIHLWVKEKMGWVLLPDDETMIVLDGGYERRDVWSRESLERWERLKNGKSG